MNQQLIDIINNVKAKISDGSDMVWTKYDNAKQLRDELEGYILMLEKDDSSCLKQIEYLFAPTASLQEHAISNNWREEYFVLSKKFHEVYLQVKDRTC